MQTQGLPPIGIWKPNSKAPAFSPQDLVSIIPQIREPVHIVREGAEGRLGLGQSGQVLPIQQNNNGSFLLMATHPALYPEWLGDRSFLELHRLRLPYVAGAMFRGIA